MKTLVRVSLCILGLYAILITIGCNLSNTEVIKWDKDGNKVYQARCGRAYFAYWFGINSGSIKADENGFEVKASGMTEHPDPNTVSSLAEGAVRGLK